MAVSSLAADTVAAVATPPGEGAIAIVRISGPEALACAGRIFRRRDHRRLADPRPRYLYHGHVVDPRSRMVVDEVLLAYFPGPRSYTGEDLIEISGHGGRHAVQAVLRAALDAGARAARPGELTLRAFLNGRIDLAQAEAVSDVIRARSDRALRLAVQGLAGGLSDRVRTIRRDLLGALAQVTAQVDFPEDDVPEVPLTPRLEPVLSELDSLLATARAGRVYREGVRLAIVGTPNAGKSSLLNRLLGSDRAIVTEVPGTTRDTLEEGLEIEGLPFVITDTAGIRPTEDPIERLGVERSRAALAMADLAVQVIDRSRPLAPDDLRISDLIGDRPAIRVANKADLPPLADLTRLPGPPLLVSAVTGAGLDELRRRLVAVATNGAAADDALIVTNPRHATALARARDHLAAAIATEQGGLPADFV
ncbi:MAG TPA: tRNA uridine-5-carboxymethylaminomethyl(34) synthesis GTPase MnmE, partial [Dehalococcoidia bacterium]|nr:tRNA uridine-5-carboxymethylaminomethyl(34) synthesis GTPase MnmE [Dehalococcoidia bacterium]